MSQPARQLGEPNQFREQHSDGFDRRGVTPIDEKLRKLGSNVAIVYSQQPKMPVIAANAVLRDEQKLGLSLYCHGKQISQGRPSLSDWSGTPMDGGGFNDEPVGLDLYDREAMAIMKFMDKKFKRADKLLAMGVWRILYEQEDMPKISWRAISYHYTKSTDEQQQIGSFKTYLWLISAEMSRLLDIYWRINPPPQDVRAKINSHAY